MSVDTHGTADVTTKEKARRLRQLSAGHAVLVLPNAWDAASAVVIAAAGAGAIATTSGGVSWSYGRGDGQQLSRQEMVDAIRRIVAAVDLPVTADIEGGSGPEPVEVAGTVHAVAEAGAVRINLEDSFAVGGPLSSITEQAGRLRAAREPAVASGLPEFVINARTDVYLFGIGEAAGRLGETLRRAEAYAAAGADGVFVPGLLDRDELRNLCARSPLPVNAMAVPSGPTITEFATAGVRRISLGTALAQSAYTAARRTAAELMTDGGITSLEGALDFAELNSLFRG